MRMRVRYSGDHEYIYTGKISVNNILAGMCDEKW